ncbi:MAG: PAS domain S-box protein [Calditrichaeota bacterium]|nr:MAG: PAS domain S-box protein [Calditrichota bacterium]
MKTIEEYRLDNERLQAEVERLRRRLSRKNTADFSEITQIYRQLVNYLSDYIYTVRVDNGRAVETIHGPGCIAVTGYSSEDYARDPELWYRMVYDSDREAVTLQSSQALRGYDVQALEHRIVHRDGNIRWVRNTIVLLRNEESELYAYNGLINDITAQKESERELLESEEKYRSLTNDVLESSRVGISILDADLKIVWVNQAYMKYLGVEREQVIGKDAHLLVEAHLAALFEDSGEFSRRVLKTYADQSAVERFECSIRNFEGLIERRLEYWSMPIYSGLYTGGRIEHYTDITEQKRILDEVIESERRYSQLLHHLTDYIYSVKVKNGQPIHTYHGQGSLAVTGYTQEDFAINPDLWIEMVHPDDQDNVREYSRLALLGKTVTPFEHRIMHRKGALRWVKSTIVHQKDETGEVMSYDGLISDITELKEAEERERLNQQQLLQAEKMATLGILVSGVAHEINNPNNFIMLNYKMIDKVWHAILPILDRYYNENGDFVLAGMPYSSAREKILDLISGIGKGSQRIQKIVSSLKDYARQDTGILESQINLNDVVETAVLIVNNLIKKTTDTFTLDLQKSLPVVRGNFQKLEQVLINLISNACQALKIAPKAIAIRTVYDKEADKVCLTVTDSGEGMDDQALKHIIDPFYTTRRESGGTGLGLSIAYAIVKDHGGELLFRSQLQAGTTATLLLPAITLNAEVIK